MMSVNRLTEEVKSFTINEGADLVGIAPVDRFKNAPLLLSPQGHLPEAKSVIVCAIHIPDGCAEFGGEPYPWMIGPYALTGGMISKLNSIAFRLSKFLEEKDYQTIPIACTMYYRGKALKEEGLDHPYLPDLSHIHAAVAAGLGEIGYSGLMLTPEYGARQRFASVITDAFLEPTPMYEGPSLCDKCLRCTKHCPAQAYTKEVNGVNKVEIGGKIFEYAKINMYRCGWRHEFNMDPDIPIPEKIDEETFLKNRKYWLQGYCCPGACLRYCLPPSLRYIEADYCNPPRRKRQSIANNSLEVRYVTEKVKAIATKAGADLIGIISVERVKDLNLEQIPPDTKSLIIVATRIHYEKKEGNVLNPLYEEGGIIRSRRYFIELEIVSYLEKLGYTSVPWEPIEYGRKNRIYSLSAELELKKKNIIKASGLGNISEDGIVITPEYGKRQEFSIIATSAPLTPEDNEKLITKIPQRKSRSTTFLKEKLKRVAFQKGADLFGITSPERINQVVNNLKNFYPQRYSVANYDRENMEWKIEYEDINLKRAEDYLPTVKSIIVIGLHYPHTILDRAYELPSKMIGSYAYAQKQTVTELGYIALDIGRFLEDMGYKSIPTIDLCGSASKSLFMAPLIDITANRFAAISAGLGEIGWSGVVLTPQYGTRQRFVAIVTDAPLKADDLYQGSPLCQRCFKCVENCPTNALSKDEITLKIDNKVFRCGEINRGRCDWSKRYGLIKGVGPEQRGSQINIMPPKKITSENFLSALNQLDPVLLPWSLLIMEKCVKVCPAKGNKN